jgi:beta-glucosidase
VRATRRPQRAHRWCALALLTASGCARLSGGGGFDRSTFGDAGGDPAKRAAALVARLTLDEEVAQLENAAPAIPRLGIPGYDWWSESLHGVARNGTATVFPQAIGLAATFDEDLLRRVGQAIADEARAKFEAARGRERGSGRYEGLTFFAPNVNIFRDPRWGRGQETYGEDPFLTARLAVAYVRGLQGDDRRRLRAAAVAKHFAAHSGPELDRHRFNARVDAHDLADTYLPQFEALVREAHVSGIMAAYNRLNGEPCVAGQTLLGQILRRQWNFEGFVVGDCGAVGDLVGGHHAVVDQAHAAALALRAGTDLDCGASYRHLIAAVRAGLVDKAEIDRAVTRLFTVRFRLGLFDPPESGPMGTHARRPLEFAPPPAHRALAREAAQKSMVLLENDGVLPVAAAVRRIAVVGPTADDVEVLMGNYHGVPIAPVTLLAGIRGAAAARGIGVEFSTGVTLTSHSGAGLSEALAAARRADLVIAVLGLSPRLEGEEGDPDGANPAGDRRDLELPPGQRALLGALLKAQRPTVVVLTGGGAIALPASPRRPNAVLMAWYPGEDGGGALADVLFGAVAPSGRLPITFYRSVNDLPPFADYRMSGRTYRYFDGKVGHAFGHGLGYGSITYPNVSVDVQTGALVTVHAAIHNAGPRPVDEVVQIYARPRPRAARDPLRSLVAFRRVSVRAQETVAVDIALPAGAFSRVDLAGRRQAAGGTWELEVAGTTRTIRIPE